MIFQPDRHLLRKQIQKYAPYIKGVVLDAGSGDGERYKSFFKFDKYIRLDINAGNNPDIIGSVENIPLASNSIDSIVCTQVLEHIRNPKAAINEFYRILKPEGYCLLTAPQLSELHEEPNDFFRFTSHGLGELFSQTGFKIILINRRGGFWSANFQMQARFLIDLLRLNRFWPVRWVLTPFIWISGMAAVFIDRLDKSRANRKHAIGWLIIAKKL